MRRTPFEFLRDDGGATMIEYGFIAALISIGIISAVKYMGSWVVIQFSTVGNNLSTS
ncbi:MAG TPA: Flp family type IVb pilin [Methylocystis sp.]|nr:Flp family type IVb pilin [Methylocystis sp.]